MRVLLLLLAASVAACAPPPPSGYEGDTTSTIGTDGILYRLSVEEGSALLEDLGEVQGSLLPGGGLTLPEVAVDAMRMPFASLKSLAVALSYDEPDDIVGFAFDADNLRFQLNQGVPIWEAAATGLALLLLGGLGVGITLTRRERRRRRAEAVARQRALHAREAERTRIARELHDGPLQDVHALRLLSASQEGLGVGDEAGRIAKELRAIAEGLRPPALGRFGLAAALSAHANRVKDRHPAVVIALDLDEDGVGANALPDVVRAALFRIAQEAITNAIEHGHAQQVRIALDLPPLHEATAAPIVLEVTDDGAGFPGAPPDLAALADSGHFGLVGMHERAEAIGGRLTLSAGGIGARGARVRAVVPDARAPHGRPSRLQRLGARTRRLRARLPLS